MQTQKRARSAKKAIFPPVRKTGPRAQHTKSTLILFLLPLVKKVIIISIIIAHAKLSRDSFTPMMFISSSGMPERVTCKISGRYVPISPTYDRNEFDQIYNKETHQNAFFEFISKFHQILNFFIAKLLSKLKIYTNSKKKFKFFLFLVVFLFEK